MDAPGAVDRTEAGLRSARGIDGRRTDSWGIVSAGSTAVDVRSSSGENRDRNNLRIQ